MIEICRFVNSVKGKLIKLELYAVSRINYLAIQLQHLEVVIVFATQETFIRLVTAVKVYQPQTASRMDLDQMYVILNTLLRDLVKCVLDIVQILRCVQLMTF